MIVITVALDFSLINFTKRCSCDHGRTNLMLTDHNDVLGHVASIFS
jgi:hypothetical protein